MTQFVPTMPATGEWHWEVIVTASVIATLPLIIVFFFFQKKIIEGATMSGMKG